MCTYHVLQSFYPNMTVICILCVSVQMLKWRVCVGFTRESSWFLVQTMPPEWVSLLFSECNIIYKASSGISGSTKVNWCCTAQNVSPLITSFTHAVLWKAMISKNGGHYTDALDLSSLGKVTDGYTPGHIHTVVTQVLTERRIQQVWHYGAQGGLC